MLICQKHVLFQVLGNLLSILYAAPFHVLGCLLSFFYNARVKHIFLLSMLLLLGQDFPWLSPA